MTYAATNYVKMHQQYRSSCINLVASENLLSPRARNALASDMASRYALRPEFYGGTTWIHHVWTLAEDLAKAVFNAEYCSVAPLSGHVSLMMTLYTVVRRSGKIAVVDPRLAGYPGLASDKIPEIFGHTVVFLPEKDLMIDKDPAVELLAKEKPDAVVLGASLILYPMPVKEISEVVHSYGGHVIYDGSHVLGLIAGKSFQQPLEEGADVLLGSTHKSFFGPQGGLILTNDKEIAEKIERNTFHKFVDNIHFNRIAALAVSLEEMKKHGRKYAEKVVENANMLAVSLEKRELKPFKNSMGFTRSHQVYLPYSEEDGVKVRDILERNHIIADMAVRLGTNEVTRRGMGLRQMDIIAEYIVRALQGENMKNKVRALAHRFKSVKFT
ncbi:MAG: hypothetical protein QXY84_03835 [Candidatus Caldarchaeum sp.]